MEPAGAGIVSMLRRRPFSYFENGEQLALRGASSKAEQDSRKLFESGTHSVEPKSVGMLSSCLMIYPARE